MFWIFTTLNNPQIVCYSGKISPSLNTRWSSGQHACLLLDNPCLNPFEVSSISVKLFGRNRPGLGHIKIFFAFFLSLQNFASTTSLMAVANLSWSALEASMLSLAPWVLHVWAVTVIPLSTQFFDAVKMQEILFFLCSIVYLHVWGKSNCLEYLRTKILYFGIASRLSIHWTSIQSQSLTYTDGWQH